MGLIGSVHEEVEQAVVRDDAGAESLCLCSTGAFPSCLGFADGHTGPRRTVFPLLLLHASELVCFFNLPLKN